MCANFYPFRRASGAIWRVCFLGDHSFEAHRFCGGKELDASVSDVFGVAKHARRRERLAQQLFAFEQRKRPEVVTAKREQVEDIECCGKFCGVSRNLRSTADA